MFLSSVSFHYIFFPSYFSSYPFSFFVLFISFITFFFFILFFFCLFYISFPFLYFPFSIIFLFFPTFFFFFFNISWVFCIFLFFKVQIEIKNISLAPQPGKQPWKINLKFSCKFLCFLTYIPHPINSWSFNFFSFFFFSDPYVRITLFRGDREDGVIAITQTKTKKKVSRLKNYLSFYIHSLSRACVCVYIYIYIYIYIYNQGNVQCYVSTMTWQKTCLYLSEVFIYLPYLKDDRR